MTLEEAKSALSEVAALLFPEEKAGLRFASVGERRALPVERKDRVIAVLLEGLKGDGKVDWGRLDGEAEPVPLLKFERVEGEEFSLPDESECPEVWRVLYDAVSSLLSPDESLPLRAVKRSLALHLLLRALRGQGRFWDMAGEAVRRELEARPWWLWGELEREGVLDPLDLARRMAAGEGFVDGRAALELWRRMFSVATDQVGCLLAPEMPPSVFTSSMAGILPAFWPGRHLGRSREEWLGGPDRLPSFLFFLLAWFTEHAAIPGFTRVTDSLPHKGSRLFRPDDWGSVSFAFDGRRKMLMEEFPRTGWDTLAICLLLEASSDRVRWS